jgi:DNA-binding HxlR family transcriptional regulator
MTITYSYDFYDTKTELLFNGRLASKIVVCLVQNVHNNENRPLRRFKIADITGLNAHNITATLDQMVKLGILVKEAIDNNPNKTGFYLDKKNPAAKALIEFITAFESVHVPAMMGH